MEDRNASLCVCVCGGGSQLQMMRETRGRGGPLQQCGYQRNYEAKPEWEVCAACVCVCVFV